MSQKLCTGWKDACYKMTVWRIGDQIWGRCLTATSSNNFEGLLLHEIQRLKKQLWKNVGENFVFVDNDPLEKLSTRNVVRRRRRRQKCRFLKSTWFILFFPPYFYRQRLMQSDHIHSFPSKHKSCPAVLKWSLSLSLSDTHTHAHSLSHSLRTCISLEHKHHWFVSRTNNRRAPTRRQTQTLSLSLTHTHAHTHTHTLSLSLTHTHKHTRVRKKEWAEWQINQAITVLLSSSRQTNKKVPTRLR